MYPTRRAVVTAAALLAVTVTASCEPDSPDSAASDKSPAEPGCPAALAKAKKSVKKAEDVDAPWVGPTSGPKAVRDKSIVFIAQTLTNPGPTGVAQGVQEAAKVVGWRARTLNGKGTPAGFRSAFDKALDLKPDGIVVAAFDPRITDKQVKKAEKRGIPVIGWHATPAPGPSERLGLFSNITSKVEDVASISADWIIARSRGRAGVVLFTDASSPFAKRKSDLIKKQLATCSDVRLLSYKNIPMSEANSRSTKEVSALLSRFGDKWTYSAAINDVYFRHAAPALRAAGKNGDGAPSNIGAGDGDPSAFQRVNGKRFQAATVPEPLSEQGWQIVDEFNRAFTDQPPSGYIAPVHISTAANSGGALSWDSEGYRQAYRKIWDAGA